MAESDDTSTTSMDATEKQAIMDEIAAEAAATPSPISLKGSSYKGKPGATSAKSATKRAKQGGKKKKKKGKPSKSTKKGFGN